MPKSDPAIKDLQAQLKAISNVDTSANGWEVEFISKFLLLLNKFFFERRNTPEELEDSHYKGNPDTNLDWKRHTEFLAVWDDYSSQVVSFLYPEKHICALASRILEIYKNANYLREIPKVLPPDLPSKSLCGLTPRQFVFIRLVHASQDFSQLLPEIDSRFVAKLKKKFKCIPGPKTLDKKEQAAEFLALLGGAERNMAERARYITVLCANINASYNSDPYGILDACGNDAKSVFNVLMTFTGIASKKANMLLRDFYERGIWIYTNNLETINIIADNRIMRIALRSGIINPRLPKLLNSLLDQYDYQYMITVKATEEAFRRVWEKAKELNGGGNIVSYPARLDEFFFKLGSWKHPKGCCNSTDITCKTSKSRLDFYAWLKKTLKYDCKRACPLDVVCPDALKRLNPPHAIQNNTWNGVFTNEGGGGGLRGI